MLLQTTGHIWTKEEVEAVADLQREFNDYLDSFRSVVSYAAQIYGFYHEITHLTENMGEFTQQLKSSPTNALAVALSTNRNKIYRELIYNSIEIINDIRAVCLSDNKMTENERMEIVFGIRPKLKLMNKKLQRLSKQEKRGQSLPHPPPAPAVRTHFERFLLVHADWGGSADSPPPDTPSASVVSLHHHMRRSSAWQYLLHNRAQIFCIFSQILNNRLSTSKRFV